jgi:hypothetical protein
MEGSGRGLSCGTPGGCPLWEVLLLSGLTVEARAGLVALLS